MKEKLKCALMTILIIYFGIATVGRLSLNKVEKEESRFHIKVLRLQLSKLTGEG